VTLISQGFTQFCSEDAAASKGRITNYTYAHRIQLL
jgi:hypothetical protein